MGNATGEAALPKLQTSDLSLIGIITASAIARGSGAAIMNSMYALESV